MAQSNKYKTADTIKWTHDETAKKFASESPEVLQNKHIKRIIQQLRSKIPPKDIPHYQLNEQGWKEGLKHFPDKEFAEEIVRRNREGWTVTEADLKKAAGVKETYKGTIQHFYTILEQFERFVDGKFMWGPFDETGLPPQFEGKIRTWPVFVKDELKHLEDNKTKIKHRLLINLSSTTEGASYNEEIRQYEKSVQYIDIKDVVKLVLDNDIQYIWAADAKDGFYRVPIEDRFVPKSAVKICGMYFFFTSLVMGMASACKLYAEFADIVCWIIRHNADGAFHPDGDGVFQNTDHIQENNTESEEKKEEPQDMLWKREKALIVHYCDDFLGGHNKKEVAQKQFDALNHWWSNDRLALPAAKGKNKPPGTSVIYIGFVIDCKNRTISVPTARMIKYKKSITEIRRQVKEKINPTIKQLQTMVGQIRSIQLIYPMVIPYLRKFERITSKLSDSPWKHAWIPARMMKDLDVIEGALLDIEAEHLPMRWVIQKPNQGDIHIFTDAATSEGVGGFIREDRCRSFAIQWQEATEYVQTEYKPDITFQELLGVVLAAEIYGKEWKEKSITMWCDNKAVVHIVTRKVACFNRPDLNDLVRRLCDIAYKYRFKFWIEHIPGDENVIADALSRNKFNRGGTMTQHARDHTVHPPTKPTEQTNELLKAWTDNVSEVMRFRAEETARKKRLDNTPKECHCEIYDRRACHDSNDWSEYGQNLQETQNEPNRKERRRAAKAEKLHKKQKKD